METLNDISKSLHNIANKANDCLLLLETAFIHNSPGLLKDCRGKLESMEKAVTEVKTRITGLIQENPDLKPYLTISLLLCSIGEHSEKLLEAVNKKIKEDILFSDRGIKEINLLFKKLSEILKTTADLFLTKSPVLIRYIKESEADLANQTIEYSTMHEERLIEGLCLPVASPLYLTMLNSIRNIGRDAKDIADKIAG
jgi:Na+/phosphate symporter